MKLMTIADLRFAILCLCVGLLASADLRFTAANAATESPARETLEQIVAVVNDDVITRTELNARVKTIKQQIAGQRAALPPDSILEKQVLERMILATLELQLAERSGVRVDDETLNRTIRRIAEENRLSLSEFRDLLEQDGYDFARFREDIRKEIIISRLRQRQVNDRLNITEQEIDNFLANQRAQGNTNEEFRIAHILLSVPDAAAPERIRAARERAASVLTELSAGADFTRTAMAMSDGQQALEGGDLGWRRMAELPTPFLEPVSRMQVGAVSEAIRSPSGFHIIKLVDRREGERHIVTQTHARHILMKPNELTSEDEVREGLSALRARILAGEDFAALAKTHSADSVSAAEGGELGWVGPGETVPPFEAAMNELTEGGISAPFQSGFGWHIVQVLERRRHDNTTTFMRSRAREVIRQRKLEEELPAWLGRLRDEAYVENRLGE